MNAHADISAAIEAKGMALAIERDALYAALQRVERSIESRDTIPILTHILLEASAGAIHLAGTNMDMDIRVSVAADVGSGGAITIPGARFASIIGGLPAGARVGLEMADGRMLIRSGRSRVSLATLPALDFPDYRLKDGAIKFELPAPELLSLIEATEWSVATEVARFYLCGVFLERVDGRLCAAATDGYTLARMDVAAPANMPPPPHVIVPAKTVAELRRTIAGSKDMVAIAITESKFEATFHDGCVLTSRLIDGTFPDYKRVIPSGNDKRVTVDRAALRAAVTRVSNLSAHPRIGVKCEFADGIVRLSINDPSVGESRDEVEADYDGPPIAIGFRPAQLIKALGAAKTETVLLKLSDAGTPAVLEEVAGSSLAIVLMPMNT